MHSVESDILFYVKLIHLAFLLGWTFLAIVTSIITVTLLQIRDLLKEQLKIMKDDDYGDGGGDGEEIPEEFEEPFETVENKKPNLRLV